MNKFLRLSVPALFFVLALSAVVPAAFAAAPNLTLGSSSGTVGSVITITNAQHYNSNAIIHLTMDGYVGNIETASITTNAGGNVTSGSITIPSVTAGAHTVTASDGTNSATAAFTVTKLTQNTLTVTGLPASATYLQSGITAGTSGGSGTGAVTYSAGASTACSVDSSSGVVLISSGTGTCTITATKASDSTYNSATSAGVSITVGKESSTTTVSCPSSVAYTGSALTPCTVSVTGTGGLSLTPSANYSNNTNAGTASASYTYAGDSNYSSSSDNKTFSITQLTPTIYVNNPLVVFNSAQQIADVLGSIAGVVSNILYNASSTAPTDVGTYAVTADFAPTDSTNYLSLVGASAGNFVISAAPVTVASVDAISDISVANGTSLGSAGLPTTAGVTLSDASTATLAVTWDAGTPTYDGATAGTYAFVGTLTLSGGVTNPGSLTAAVNVIVAAVPPAACNASTFDSASLGSVNGQDGWTITGASFDQAIVDNTYGYTSFGCKTLRISDSVTSGSFGDQLYSPSTTNEAGETDALNGSMSAGTRQPHFEAQFDLASVMSAQQSGMHMSVSPDRGDGARMSYLRFEDGAAGINVFFDDVQGTTNPANFVETQIATDLSRTTSHTIKFVMDFVDGDSNDVVKIYIDGTLVHTGTSWENYYRFDPESNPSLVSNSRTVDSLLFRMSGTATPANAGNGYLIDAVSLSSSGAVAPVTTHTLTYTAGTNGSIGGTATQTVNDGATGTAVSAVPEPGYTFVRWSDASIMNPRIDTNVTSDIAVTAEFAHIASGRGGLRASPTALATPAGRVLGAATSTVPSEVLGTTTYMFSKDLRFRMNNADVAELQKYLVAHGYAIPDSVTNYFGVQTLAAVKAFQKANGLPPTGYVGALTRELLNKTN